MKEQLRTFCRSLGITAMGITSKGPYLELEKILELRQEKGHYTEFEEKSLRKRIDPSVTMEDVQSVIVCLFPYQVPEEGGNTFATYTYALDYHLIIREKLEKIGQFLTSNIPGFHYQAFVDTGPLVDRYLAYLAGLGFYGLNNHIITDEYGSYVLIGYLLTNELLPTDEPLGRTCFQCGSCIKKCPGQALHGEFGMDPQRCRSYLTQKKGELTAEEIAILKKDSLVFGCDICQKVCPHNQGKSFTPIPEFKENLMPTLTYEEVVTISNKEFMRRYGKRAFSWRGRKLIVRNFEYLL